MAYIKTGGHGDFDILVDTDTGWFVGEINDEKVAEAETLEKLKKKLDKIIHKRFNVPAFFKDQFSPEKITKATILSGKIKWNSIHQDRRLALNIRRDEIADGYGRYEKGVEPKDIIKPTEKNLELIKKHNKLFDERKVARKKMSDLYDKMDRFKGKDLFKKDGMK